MIDFIKNLNFPKLFEKMKPLGIAAICFIAVFIAGFGAGRTSGGGSASDATTKRSLSNYNTNAGDKAKTDGAGAAAANKNTNTSSKSSAANAVKTPTTPVDPANCYIKGSKSKTYHMPGGSFYERTNPAACFNSEEEAQAAGYKKSSR